jgi:hypothetical protein
MPYKKAGAVPNEKTEKANHYIKLYQAGLARRSTLDILWQRISDYIVPWRNDIISRVSPGLSLTNKIFSSKAPNALTIAAAATHGTLTPETIKWFNLGLSDPSLVNDVEAQRWLEACRDDMLRSINYSNYSAEGQEVTTDLFAYGTGCMFVEEDEDTLGNFICTAVQPGLYVISEDKHGHVDTLYRQVNTLSVRAAAAAFGEDKLPEKAQKQLGTSKEEDLMTLLHAIAPRPGVDPSMVDAFTPADQLPWASVYIDIPSRTILRDSGFHEFPAVVPRFWKIAGEVYGRGPGMTALPDIQTLNRLVELRLKAQALTVAPPILQRDKGIIGETRLIPLAKIIARDMDALKPLDLRINFAGIELDQDRLEQSIDRIFYIDQIQFAPMGKTPLSATEASLRFEMMQRILGPALGRTVNEYLNPFLNRVFRIRQRAGFFPQMPMRVIDSMRAGQTQLNIEYTGPLSRAQLTSEVESVQKFYAIAAPIAAQFPEVMSHVKHNEVGKFLANSTGMPAKTLKTEEELEADAEQQAAVQQQAGQQAQAAQVAQSLGDVAPYIKATQGGGI